MSSLQHMKKHTHSILGPSNPPRVPSDPSSASPPNLNSPKHDKRFLFTAKPKAKPKPAPVSKMITQLNLECEGEQAYTQHLLHTFNAMRYIQSINPANESQLQAKSVSLPRITHKKKTVVFDLDETLVHCCSNAESAEVRIEVLMPSGDRLKCGINIRPFVHECLRAANKYYEVIVFTASHKCYADTVLDYLDPTGELIQHRLYRENCLVTDNLHIKDLRILENRRLQDIIIVDNAAYSFAYQIDNGVPIISWYSDQKDRELYNLIDYLNAVQHLEDLRHANRETFHLHTFCNDYLRDFVRENKENTHEVS